MGTYNILQTTMTCPFCTTLVDVEIEMFFGNTSRMDKYLVGDPCQWVPGKALKHGGRPEKGNLDGEGYTECPNCGRDFFVKVLVREDRIDGVESNMEKPAYIQSTGYDWLEKEQLHFAAADGDIEKVKKLVADGYPVNDFDDLGMTPLHYAARNAHLAIMQLLLKAGADVNAHDAERIGNTPLREVAANCSYEVAKILMDAGADPTIPGWMQITALHQAEARRNPEGVKVYRLLKGAMNRQ